MSNSYNNNHTQPAKFPLGVYGLIGFPLKHSFSSKFFNEKFAREGIDAEYLNFEIEDILQIREVILFNQYLYGLNVTIPYKEQVIQFLNEITPEAQKIGAVNTIKIEREPGNMYFYNLIGYNTDYVGFKKSIEPLIRSEVHKKALILGTGGASKAVRQALEDMNIEWKYVSRSSCNDRFTYEELNQDVLNEYKIIVNCSPVGTFPNTDECPDIPYQFLSSEHLLYDLVYNPAETLFLKKGKTQGATIKNGSEMLELQALAAWEIWTQK